MCNKETGGPDGKDRMKSLSHGSCFCLRCWRSSEDYHTIFWSILYLGHSVSYIHESRVSSTWAIFLPFLCIKLPESAKGDYLATLTIVRDPSADRSNLARYVAGPQSSRMSWCILLGFEPPFFLYCSLSIIRQKRDRYRLATFWQESDSL